ncbi:lipid kinase [Enterobacter sp. E105B]|uniref:lipid kinase n=1 Tax=Enterobacter sp. E105B TaxID=3047465 RepID=UPI0025A10E83|nr:lipid kinase [Enterobacter sp. E105B]
MKQKALLLINERSRKGKIAASQARELLMKHGLNFIEPAPCDEAGFSELIEHHASDVSHVIVGGGDGTLNTCLKGLISTGLPLGILPLGTANDFARTVGIPADLDEAVKIIAQGHLRDCDLGLVNDHPFLNVSSIGFSVNLARNLSEKAKKRWGVAGYALAALFLLRQSRPFSATLHADGKVQELTTVQFSVGNGRFYGGGLAVSHTAAPDDGLLDVYSLEVAHWWQLITLIPYIKRGTQGKLRHVRSFTTTALSVQTRRPHYINADGEIIGCTPARFSLQQKALRFFAPETSIVSGKN